MDGWLARARTFAEEAAKKSQELASQTAKYSEQLAKDAAKKSRELAEKSRELAEKSRVLAGEAAKKADIGYKALVKDFNASALTSRQKPPTEEELQEYGITPEFRDFVKGLTIKTFKDFPLEEVENMKAGEGSGTEGEAVTPAPEEGKHEFCPQISKDLTKWQERHATLVLLVVPEISDFRYVLCPRRMTERVFWRIYFIVVRTHVAPYEARAAESAAKQKAEQDLAAAEADQKQREQELAAVAQRPQETAPPSSSSGIPSAGPAASTAVAAASGTGPLEGKKDKKGVESEQDLDAYLMGALGDEVAGDDDDDEGDFDPEDFDQFVNNGALDSPPSDTGTEKKDGSKSRGSSSEPLSDGELVEAPSPDSEPAQKRL